VAFLLVGKGEEGVSDWKKPQGSLKPNYSLKTEMSNENQWSENAFLVKKPLFVDDVLILRGVCVMICYDICLYYVLLCNSKLKEVHQRAGSTGVGEAH